MRYVTLLLILALSGCSIAEDYIQESKAHASLFSPFDADARDQARRALLAEGRTLSVESRNCSKEDYHKVVEAIFQEWLKDVEGLPGHQEYRECVLQEWNKGGVDSLIVGFRGKQFLVACDIMQSQFRMGMIIGQILYEYTEKESCQSKINWEKYRQSERRK